MWKIVKLHLKIDTVRHSGPFILENAAWQSTFLKSKCRLWDWSYIRIFILIRFVIGYFIDLHFANIYKSDDLP